MLSYQLLKYLISNVVAKHNMQKYFNILQKYFNTLTRILYNYNTVIMLYRNNMTIILFFLAEINLRFPASFCFCCKNHSFSVVFFS